MTYLFAPRNITPNECFSVVRSASHQANFFAVANGVVDVATNNSVGLVFATRQNPAMARNVEVIWSSPPLPESSILVRRDLDPALRERIRQFFLTYGVGSGPDADRQRGVLRGLEYGGFSAANNSYLDPVRLTIARAQQAYDRVQREIAAHGTRP
jgi:phosphonate transport system substrate-binding protein